MYVHQQMDGYRKCDIYLQRSPVLFIKNKAFVGNKMQLEKIVLHETSQTHELKYSMISMRNHTYMCINTHTHKEQYRRETNNV